MFRVDSILEIDPSISIRIVIVHNTFGFFPNFITSPHLAVIAIVIRINTIKFWIWLFTIFFSIHIFDFHHTIVEFTDRNYIIFIGITVSFKDNIVIFVHDIQVVEISITIGIMSFHVGVDFNNDVLTGEGTFTPWFWTWEDVWTF
jgi:hypothetical protein